MILILESNDFVYITKNQLKHVKIENNKKNNQIAKGMKNRSQHDYSQE